MAIPEHIIEILKDLRQRIDSRGDLAYPYRVRLLRAFDQLPGKDERSLGTTLRAKLALKCAYKCVPLWQEQPTELDLGKALSFADRCRQDKSNFAELQSVSRNIQRTVDSVLARGHGYMRGAYAGWASVAAISAVLLDEVLDSSVTAEQLLNPENWSSSFCASLAFAGGGVWLEEKEVDDEQRRLYWSWYLDNAVPSLWCPAASDSGNQNFH